ncbi:MAG: site-2 protease family protein [Acidobacteria bacterium]|nr:site-2 protease family protein [Acidobacteriota bacterium]
MLFENPLSASAFIGFFIQGLNLLPVGQLDGGHLLYAGFPRSHRLISRFVAIAFVFMTPLGLHFLIWALLFLILGTGHPHTLNDSIPLGRKEIITIIVSFIIFIVSFQPIPFVV